MTGESTKLERISWGSSGAGPSPAGLRAAAGGPRTTWSSGRAATRRPSAPAARSRTRRARGRPTWPSWPTATLVVEAVAEDARGQGRAARAAGRRAARRRACSRPPRPRCRSTTLAAASGRPDRFAALHVFNPVERMALVELCFPAAGHRGHPRRVLRELCEALGQDRGRGARHCRASWSTGCCSPTSSTRCGCSSAGGLDAEAVDTCMKLGAGHPMGPLALLDFVGLDVAAAIGESIGAEVPERVRELVAEGRLGRKSGAGFYEYGRLARPQLDQVVFTTSTEQRRACATDRVLDAAQHPPLHALVADHQHVGAGIRPPAGRSPRRGRPRQRGCCTRFPLLRRSCSIRAEDLPDACRGAERPLQLDVRAGLVARRPAAHPGRR